MGYLLKIFAAEDITETERAQAEQRFRRALEASLGSETLVVPAYQTYLRLLQIYGGQARPWPVSPAEQLVVVQWEEAETAATRAAFGAERYMGDAHYELSLLPKAGVP